jgi:hypothetical protein
MNWALQSSASASHGLNGRNSVVGLMATFWGCAAQTED